MMLTTENDETIVWRSHFLTHFNHSLLCQHNATYNLESKTIPNSHSCMDIINNISQPNNDAKHPNLYKYMRCDSLNVPPINTITCPQHLINVDEQGTPSKPPYFKHIGDPNAIKSCKALTNFNKLKCITLDKKITMSKSSLLAQDAEIMGKKLPTRKINLFQRFYKIVWAYIHLTLGIQFTLIQSMCTALAGLLISYVQTVSPLEITMIRLIFQLFLCFPMLIYYKQSLNPSTWIEFWSLAFRSITSTIGVTAMIYSYHFIPISDANALCRTSPLFVIILGLLFLPEERSLKPFDFGVILFTITGVVFITRPEAIFGPIPSHQLLVPQELRSPPQHIHIYNNFTIKNDSGHTNFNSVVSIPVSSLYNNLQAQSHMPRFIQNISALRYPQQTNLSKFLKAGQKHSALKGVAFALSSAITFSISMVFIKRCSHTPLAVNMFYFSVWGILLTVVVGVPLKLFTLIPCYRDRWFLLGASICGALSQVFLYLGLQYEKAGIVSALNATSIICSQFLQIVFLHIIPMWNSWTGSTIIMITIVCYGLRKWTLTSREKGPLISKHLF